MVDSNEGTTQDSHVAKCSRPLPPELRSINRFYDVRDQRLEDPACIIRVESERGAQLAANTARWLPMAGDKTSFPRHFPLNGDTTAVLTWPSSHGQYAKGAFAAPKLLWLAEEKLL